MEKRRKRDPFTDIRSIDEFVGMEIGRNITFRHINDICASHGFKAVEIVPNNTNVSEEMDPLRVVVRFDRKTKIVQSVTPDDDRI